MVVSAYFVGAASFLVYLKRDMDKYDIPFKKVKAFMKCEEECPPPYDSIVEEDDTPESIAYHDRLYYRYRACVAKCKNDHPF